jgi:hypothetical protein
MVLPQLLGVLVHFRMKQFPRLAYFAGFLLTTIFSFFLILTILNIYYSPKVEPGEHVCGLYGMAIAFMFLFLISAQIVLSIFAQFLFRYLKWRFQNLNIPSYSKDEF